MNYTIDRTTWRSPTHSPRTQTPNTAVVHSCEGALPSPRATSLPWLCNPRSRVSTHYYICRDTTIYQLVDDMRVANHAGGLQSDGTWTAQEAYSNPYSLGVELEHRRGQDWPSAQKAALAWLLRALTTRWRFPIDRIETHGQIAIKGPYRRKTDPSDWPHAAFVAWRAQLAAPADPFARWGPIGKPTGIATGFAVPRAWLVNQVLGACVAPETYSTSGRYSVTEFEGGIVTYFKARNVALVERF